MAAPRYALWSDNLVPRRQLRAQEGTLFDEFPVTNLGIGDPSTGFLFDGTGGRIVVDLIDPSAPLLVALIHHNFPFAKSVRLQSKATNPATWPAPSAPEDDFAFSTSVVDEVDGYRPDIYMIVPHAVGGSPIFAMQYWSVVAAVSGTAQFALGELFMSEALREFPRGFRIGFTFGSDVETLVHETYAKVSLRSRKGFRRDVMTGVQRCHGRSEADQMIDLFRSLGGRAEPLLLIPDPDLPYCMLGLLEQDSIRATAADAGVYDVAVTFRQLSRGLVW